MSWRVLHPSLIPREEWLARLNQVPDASPYLLPEWSQFWCDVWPATRAEVYDNGATLIPSVVRRRFGLDWRFAQPYGTDCVIGDPVAVPWLELATAWVPRTVEIALTARVPTGLAGWNHVVLPQNCWMIDTAGRTHSELAITFSGSHRRNINKACELQLRFEDTPDYAKLISLWQDRERAPRFMLNDQYAAALIDRFAPINSLVWKSAWSGERPVAGTVFLVFNRVAVSVDTIVDRDARFRGAGHLLMSETLKRLIESGITRIDLGGVPGGNEHAGLDEFKSGWGAFQNTIHTTRFRRSWYSLLRNLRS